MDGNGIIDKQSDDAMQEPTPISTKYAFGHVVNGDGLVRVKIPDNLSDGTGTPGPTGPPGPQGPPGEDGITPHIGTNGNWYIGSQDTGIPATGPAGADGKDGEPGVTPHIGENGNWYIGDTDTGIPATGPVGPPGADGKDGSPYFGVCEADAWSNEKTVTVDSSFELKDGIVVSVLFKYGSAITLPYLNVNNTGSFLALGTDEGATLPSIGCDAGTVMDFLFRPAADGKQAHWIRKDAVVASDSIYGLTKLNPSVDSTSKTEAATPSAVKKAYDHAQNALELATEALEAAQNAGGDGEAEAKPALFYGRCTSAASTAAKVVTVDAGFELVIGATVFIQFNSTNTATAPTLNVNNTGAKSIKKYGTTAPDTYFWAANSLTAFVYDGDYWKIVDGTTASLNNYGRTKLSSSVSSTSTVLAATPSAVKQAYDQAVDAQTTAEAAKETAAAALPKDGGTMTGNLIVSSRDFSSTTASVAIQGTNSSSQLTQGIIGFLTDGRVYLESDKDGDMKNRLTLADSYTSLLKPLTVASGGTGATTAAGALANLGAAAKWDVLWTNGSPTSNFGAQTRTISGLGNYNFFVVICAYSTSYSDGLSSGVIYVPSGKENNYLSVYCAARLSAVQGTSRTFTFKPSENQIQISTGYNTNASGYTTSNNYAIPIFIIATKI